MTTVGGEPLTVVNVNKDDDVDHVDIPLSEAELYALQARLAAEQDTLVAERSKANRLSSSITNNMYQECRSPVCSSGHGWPHGGDHH